MNNAVYGKAMENVGNIIYLKLVSNKKDYLKCNISHKVFNNVLVAIRKVTLTLNRTAYVRIGILDLSKVLISKFYYDYIKEI